MFQFSVGLFPVEKNFIIKNSKWNGIIMQVFWQCGHLVYYLEINWPMVFTDSVLSRRDLHNYWELVPLPILLKEHRVFSGEEIIMLFRIIVIYCLGLLFFTLHEFQFNCSDPVLMKTDSLFSDFPLCSLFVLIVIF